MSVFVALLRAVNVGATGKLPMTELKAMCEASGFTDVKTYIASGNVVFRACVDAGKVKAALEARLADYAGKPVGVFIRTPTELSSVLAANPFPDAPGNRTVAIFLEAAPPAGALDDVKHRKSEVLALGNREIYVRYDDGMADSRLVIPAAKAGTARNMNTVAKLAGMSAALED